MSSYQIFYGVIVPSLIFIISLVSTILLYRRFSRELKEKSEKEN